MEHNRKDAAEKATWSRFHAVYATITHPNSGTYGANELFIIKTNSIWPKYLTFDKLF